jgi:hypothetical protein
LLASAGVVVLGVVGPVGSPSARADSTYSGLADARLIAINFTAEPAVVFGQLIDGGASVVQAELSSLGTSTAFASDPYPSQSAVLLPGLIAGLSNGQTSQLIPNYPLIASSSNPTQPEQRVEAGPVVLEANSAETSSRGRTANGANTGQADVHYEPLTGQLIARAEAIATDIAISDQLVINGVRSAATATRAPSGALQLTSDFSVATLTIAGQRVPLGAGLSGPNGALTTSAAGAAMLKALEASGTTITYLPQTRTADGITSAGLRIRSVQHPPSQLASGVEEVVAEVTLGQTAASVQNRALPLPPSTSALTPQSSLPTDATPPTLGTTAPPGALPSSPAGGTVTPTASDAVPPTVTFAPVASPNALVTGLDLDRFYPVLPLAGLLMLAWLGLVRKLGAR